MTYTKPFYLTKKKRKLTGKRLETFNRFWDIFDYKKGRAEAADSWLDIPTLTDSIVADIYLGAKNESIRRRRLIESGRTPKMAQGWLTARRWEDESSQAIKVVARTPSNGVENMVRALNMLTNLGEEKFVEFCKGVKMPPGDVEAVRFKFSGQYDVKRLARGIG